MKLRFCTSIATGLGSFLDGQVIDVPTLPHEFRGWLDRGVIVIEPDEPVEVAVAPLGETATSRPFRGAGRGRRSYASRPVPA